MPKIQTGKGMDSDLLIPIRKPPKRKTILVYDFESKDGESQEPGFTRPFMVGFLDEDDQYTAFWNETNGLAGGDFRRRAVQDGGCVDLFMRHIVGHPKRDGKKYKPPNKAWMSGEAEIYAHNGGRFDATFLLVWLYNHADEFDVEVTSVQGRAQRVFVRPKGRKGRRSGWLFSDSALVLQMKLEQATMLYSKGKKKLASFDQSTPEWDRTNWELYNGLDCRGLRDALVGFSDMLEEEGGELGMTCPATAMKLFRRVHLKKPLRRARHFRGCDRTCKGCERGPLCDGKCHGCFHQWLTQGLRGGRVEIFQRFAPAPVYYYDRNSSYPAEALKPMPVGEPMIQSGADFLKTHEKLKQAGKIGFVEATVYIPPTCKIPPLPLVHDGKMKFPSGVFSGVFAYDELMLIYDPFVGGRILDVKLAAWFKAEIVFESFMRKMYQYRLDYRKRWEHRSTCRAQNDASVICKGCGEKDPKKMSDEQLAEFARSEFAKLMMNALIGKFATSSEREEVVFIRRGDAWPVGGRPIDGKHETCQVWLVPRYIDASYMIPHLNMQVCAGGRIAWWLAARDVTLAGGEVFYGDTDSIQCSIEFPEHLVDAKELGKWKREYEDDEYDAEYVQAKNYGLNSVLGGKSIVHMKGVPRQHQNMRTFMEFRNGRVLRWVDDRTSQHKSVLRSLEKGGPEGISMHDSIKSLRSEYDKRLVHEDGTTSPIVIRQEEQYGMQSAWM